MQRDDPVAGVAQIGAYLLDHMLAQGARPARGLLDRRTVSGAERSDALAPGLRLAAEIDRPVSFVSRCDAPVLGGIGSKLIGERLGQRRRRRFLDGAVRADLRCFGEPALAPLQQRVLLDFGIDEIDQLEVRQLQHLDRLLQLRRHHQSLRLAQLKPLRKADSVQITITLRSERLIG